MATSNSPFPRWKQLIAQGIKDGMADKQKGVLYYALSTVDASGRNGESVAPHVRMVVHRGFVNEQRSSSSETGVEPFNDAFGSNACLMTTTDIRAPKAQQILRASSSSSVGGQGARGEVCWWMEHNSLQFRIAGTLHLLPTNSHPAAKDFDGARLAPPPSAESSADLTHAFDWPAERKRIFDKLSPELLASFTRPTPGGAHPQQDKVHASAKGPGEGSVEDAKTDAESPWPLQLSQPGEEGNEEQRRLLQESEKNFALVILNPDSIDVVDLDRDRRSLFTRIGTSSGANSEWKEERLVP